MALVVDAPRLQFPRGQFFQPPLCALRRRPVTEPPLVLRGGLADLQHRFAPVLACRFADEIDEHAFVGHDLHPMDEPAQACARVVKERCG